MTPVKLIGSFVIVATVALGLVTAPVRASGPLGIYGIVEKVVFEPAQGTPDRVQIWGAFAYADGDPRPGASPAQARRGYLYFRLPDPATDAQVSLVRTEWKDLASLAGTGQAVGFGRWAYVGSFPSVPDVHPSNWTGLARGGAVMDLRVRPASEAPAAPAMYETNAGLVKLAAEGSQKDIVAALKKALGP